MADMVRAVVQTGPRQMEMREFPRPVIGPDDGALLRVEACGICGQRRRAVQGRDGHPRAADDPRSRAARHHRGDRAGDRRPLGRLGRRPGGGGDPHPLPVLRPVPGRAVHAVQEPGRQPRRLQPARARPRALRRLRRVHAPAPELDRAPGAGRHPGRDRGHVQPARRGRALGAAVRRGAPRVLGAGARGRAARPGRDPRLQVRRRRADHRHRPGPRRQEARARARVRRRPHDQRGRGGHGRAGPRADRRRRGRRGARPHPDGAAADPRRDQRGPLGRHDRAGRAEGAPGHPDPRPTC